MALNREQLLSRRVKKQPVRCVLADGEEVLIRRPSGRDFREWKRLMRNEDGTWNEERGDLSEEVWIALLVVDDSTGDPVFSIDDIVNLHALDEFPLDDLNAIKSVIDQLVGSRNAKIISDEDIAKN